MKFTMSWLREHLETDASVAEVAEALTDLGLEVEGVTDPAAALRPFRIGHVESAAPHPDADRLRVCMVRTADGVKQIVCGAPNAREGITVVVAAPGVYVPGIDTTIGASRIRGVESFGMMASEREMELSDEHDGIIELPSGEVGESFAGWLAANRPEAVDPVIEIAITPNRPDALGVHGIARDLAARGLGTLLSREIEPVAGTFASPMGVTIEEDAREGCPVFHGRLIRGVRNGPSPDWLQGRLKAVGLRPISFLVDVTNFFTIDINRPLHVFDAGRLSGDLRVHLAAGGERMEALDERTYEAPEGAVLISDEAGVQSLGGIMGGAATGVDEGTTDVFLECAYFDPVRTALTGRALRIHSDARYRFERGIDPESVRTGIERATRMILDHAGGEPSEVVVAGAVPDHARAYRFDPERMRTLVGMDVPEPAQRASLEALGFRVEGGMAHVPSWRPDVRGEADIVEEVARVASLTRLEAAPLPRAPGVAASVLTPQQVRERTARRMAAALGYDECVTYSFVDRAAAEAFGGGSEATRIENPISSEMSHLRPSLLPGLLRAAARNQARGAAAMALFECGTAFHGGAPGEQHAALTGLLVGAPGRDVHGGVRAPDLYDARGDAEAVLKALGAPAGRILPGAPEWWHPGRSGRVALGPKVALATFGELHPRVLAAMDVKGPAAAFTVHLDAIPMPKAKGASRGALAVPSVQAVERDYAFVLDRDVPAQDVVAAARGADKALIADVRVFDAFEGGAVGEGRKSLAIAVRLQPMDRTLTEAEIAAVGEKVVAKVAKATGGTLRS